jgi:hypothetical protein
MSEPRTLEDLLSDLLLMIEDGQWSGQTRIGCHCHPEYIDSCPDCGAPKLEWISAGHSYRDGKHMADCARVRLIKETSQEIERQAGIQKKLV